MIIKEYNNTDRVMHTVSQYLARIGKSFLDQKDDDSHTNLAFDSIGNRVTGRWIQSEQKRYLPAVELSPLAFVWLDEYLNRAYEILLAGRNKTSIEEDLKNSLLKIGLDPNELIEKMHYEIPVYPETEDIIRELTPAGAHVWSQYRKLANTASFELMNFLQGESEIRVWPHHFDTGIYVNTFTGMGIGFGLAMEDQIGGEPYFYVSAYPDEGVIDYSKLPVMDHGKWIVADFWKGAVLTLSSLDFSSYEKQNIALKQFIKDTTGWFLNI
ncbi:MAG: hypothetical protein K9J25_06045 [Bacteroidales bacterium]|nr:hypothetical protein [Bacteroidales bacterium]